MTSSVDVLLLYRLFKIYVCSFGTAGRGGFEQLVEQADTSGTAVNGKLSGIARVGLHLPAVGLGELKDGLSHRAVLLDNAVVSLPSDNINGLEDAELHRALHKSRRFRHRLFNKKSVQVDCVCVALLESLGFYHCSVSAGVGVLHEGLLALARGAL